MAIASEQQAQVAVTSLSATTHSATTMHSTSTSTSPSTPTLASLPPELIDLVLSHIPPNALQQTTLALTRVIPQSNISHRYLYRHIRLTSDAQLRPVWDQLRRVKYGPLEQHLDDPDAQDPQSILGGIESFAFLPFTGDATTLTSILRLLPDLRHLILNVGTNFAPEHLGECFEVKRTRVRGVEIRFRPYVDKARYYQFLKVSPPPVFLSPLNNLDNA
jgi:diketogulonate reductase-like aldo/keto reductase